MLHKYFYFGEIVEGFEVRVLNEREVRAGAGILFAVSLPIFLTSCQSGNFFVTNVFITLFMLDFFIRVCINPKYAPSLILGRMAVRNQKVEYVGAPQKRVAWGLGLALSVFMFVSMGIFSWFSPLNMLLCMACLVMLFFESAFGICLGCKLYNVFSKNSAKLCPGGVCEVFVREPIQKVGWIEIVLVIVFLVGAYGLTQTPFLQAKSAQNSPCDTGCILPQAPTADCVIPDWVKKIGHEEMYRQQHCK